MPSSENTLAEMLTVTIGSTPSALVSSVPCESKVAMSAKV